MSLTLSMLQSADVSRFGWTLVHSLWQGAAIAALLTLMLFALRRSSSQARYVAGCVAMTLMLIAPVATFLVTTPAPQPAPQAPLAVAPVAAPRIVASDAMKPASQTHVADITVRSSVPDVDRQLHPENSADEATVAAIVHPTPRVRAQQIFPWVVSIWALGVLAMSLWNLGGWVALHRLKTVGAKPASQEIERQLTGLRKRLGLQQMVKIVESVRVRSPLVIGAFKPIILLPASVLAELPVAQLESILAHELAHIRRHDYLINLIQSVIETLLFYHPATWWISRVIRTERENCCDDIAIAICNDRATYASALAGIAAAQASNLAVAANGGVLINRVRRIMGLPQARQRGSAGWAVGAIGLAACLTFTLTVATPIRIKAQTATTQPASNMPVLDLLVIDASTKKPLPGTEISVRQSGKSNQTRSDALGHARIAYDKGAANTVFDIYAKHAAYVSTGIHMATPKADPIPNSFTLPMARGTPIGAHVVNEQKQPIIRATVTLQISNSAESEPRVPYTMSIYESAIQTDEDGNWSYDATPHDAALVAVRLSHNDYESDTFETTRKPPIAELRNGSSVLVMKKGLEVTGRVEDAQGKPISGAKLVLGSAGYDRNSREAQSGADGKFALLHCSANPATVLMTTASGFAPADTRFELTASKNDVVVRLSPAKTFKFVVVDYQNKPVADADVRVANWHGVDSLLRWSAKTDAAGHATWSDAPADLVTFSVIKRDYIVSQFQHLAGDGEQQVKLFPHVAVNGTVVDDVSGQPIPKFQIVKGFASAGRPQIFWERGRNSVSKTFEAGKFTFTEMLERDGYGVRIEADGYLPYESKIYHKEDVNVALDVRLKRGAPITAVVVSPDGKPLADVDVLIASPTGQIMIDDGKPTQQTMTARTKTDANGVFTLSAQVGVYAVVVVYDKGYVKLEPDQVKDRVVVPAWGRIDGTAKVGAKPAANKRMVASDLTSSMDGPRVMIRDHATVDATGHYLLTHVPPGKLQVGIEQVVSMTGGGGMIYTVQAQHPDMVAGQSLTLNFGGLGRPVLGRLVAAPELLPKIDWSSTNAFLRTKIDPPKRELPANIATMDLAARQKLGREWAESPEGKAYRALSDKALHIPFAIERDGTFRIDDVPAGIYVLNFSIMERPSGQFRNSIKVLASGSQQVTIDPMPGDRSDEPLNVGTIGVTGNKALAAGSFAPGFDTVTLDGKPLQHADFSGKYVLVNFWATWCGPCIAEMPALKEAYEMFKDKPNFRMVGLSLDENTDSPRSYVAKEKLGWTQGYLGSWAKTSIPDVWGIHGIPATFLIGPDGKIIAADLHGPQLKEAIAAALAEKKQ